MSIENDLATEATPSFTCSITEGFSSEWAVVVVEGAGSPANLVITLSIILQKLISSPIQLVRYDGVTY
jgi:hypothetical protein